LQTPRARGPGTTEFADAHNWEPCGWSGLAPRPFTHHWEGDPDMLWTILIVLAIIALVLFILGRMRGRRGV
jgi:hypothetical protein